MEARPGVDELLEPFRDDPRSSALLSDFDGTLAPIVDDPATATATGGAIDLLGALAERYRTVGVVSGRPLAFLVARLPDSLDLAGQYGLEMRRDGVVTDAEGAGAWREAIQDVIAMAHASAPDGAVVEPKGLSLTVHYRQRPDLAGDVKTWADQAARRSGLLARAAKMSVELHPPVPVDKGTTIASFAAGARNVLWVGDDIGDLDGYDALDVMEAEGAHTVRLAIDTDETPAAMLERADAVVAGPAALVELLGRLL